MSQTRVSDLSALERPPVRSKANQHGYVVVGGGCRTLLVELPSFTVWTLGKKNDESVTLCTTDTCFPASFGLIFELYEVVCRPDNTSQLASPSKVGNFPLSASWPFALGIHENL